MALENFFQSFSKIGSGGMAGIGLLAGANIGQGLANRAFFGFNEDVFKQQQTASDQAFSINERAFRERDADFIDQPFAAAGGSGIRSQGAPLVVSTANAIRAKRDALIRRHNALIQSQRLGNQAELMGMRKRSAVGTSLLRGIGQIGGGLIRSGLFQNTNALSGDLDPNAEMLNSFYGG